MKMVYKVIGDTLKTYQERPDDYILKTNEIVGGYFQKPIYLNGKIVEGWTSDNDIAALENAKRNKINIAREFFMQDFQRHVYYYIRNQVSNTPIPTAIKNEDHYLIEEVELKADEINDLTTIEEVEAYEV